MKEKTDYIIDYDSIVTDQLRAVVPAVLSTLLADNPDATDTPAPHYFYITFATNADGVSVPPYLKEQYPEEMTIVLQYQFWNLAVGDKAFSVVLSFGKTPAALTIPYHAIIQFSDPAVNFMLRFDDRTGQDDEASAHKQDIGQDIEQDIGKPDDGKNIGQENDGRNAKKNIGQDDGQDNGQATPSLDEKIRQQSNDKFLNGKFSDGKFADDKKQNNDATHHEENNIVSLAEFRNQQKK